MPSPEDFDWLWLNVVASPAAALLAGAFTLWLFIFTGRHREPDGKLAPTRLYTGILLGLAVYAIVVACTGQLIWHKSIARTIERGFGEDRVSWVLVGVAIDMLLRLWQQFDPPPAPASATSTTSAGTSAA
jgi:hypothetical protein